MTDIIFLVLAIYFGVGICAIALLDILTHRVRSKLYSASLDTQHKIASTGNFVGSKTSVALVMFALWLFWPVAIYGALTPSKGSKTDE